MSAVHNLDYKDRLSYVNSIDENEKLTPYDLDCLYAGQDLVKGSMSTALISGGRANEVLEQRLSEELNQLFADVSLNDVVEKVSVTQSVTQDCEDVITSYPQIHKVDRLDDFETPSFQWMSIENDCDTSSIKELEAIRSKRSLIEEREKFKLKDENQTRQLSDLKNYKFNEQSEIKIKAVIDFLDIQFSTDKDYNQRDLKGALTKISGHRYFVKQLSARIFEIRLHDIKNKKDLIKRLQPLTRFNKSANPLDFPIKCIERSIDFYADEFNEESLASLAFAIFKSLRLGSADNRNVRLYRTKGETFKLGLNQYEPCSLNDFIYLVMQGFNIGINDERVDDHYHHIYLKKTDTIDGKLIQLPRKQWRIRCELRSQGNGLVTTSNEEIRVKDLKKALRAMSGRTKFVTLKDDAISYVRTAYDNFPLLWGMERSQEFNSNRHKQPQLKRSVVTARAVNQVIANRQEDLARKFLR